MHTGAGRVSQGGGGGLIFFSGLKRSTKMYRDSQDPRDSADPFS